MNASPGPPAHEVPVEEARAAHTAESVELCGPGEPVAEVRDVRVPAAGGDVLVRAFRPEGDGPLPVVAYLHGGGWMMGNVDSYDTLLRALANATGAIVAGIEYRLAPEHRFPAALEDSLAAIRWLAAHADELGGDGSRLAVAGDSAGGNLAAVTARRLRGELPIALQVLIYPVTDARANLPSYREFADGHGLSAASMRRFWDLYLDGADGSDPDASPLRAADLAGVAPALVLTADGGRPARRGRGVRGRVARPAWRSSCAMADDPRLLPLAGHRGARRDRRLPLRWRVSVDSPATACANLGGARGPRRVAPTGVRPACRHRTTRFWHPFADMGAVSRASSHRPRRRPCSVRRRGPPLPRRHGEPLVRQPRPRAGRDRRRGRRADAQARGVLDVRRLRQPARQRAGRAARRASPRWTTRACSSPPAAATRSTRRRRSPAATGSSAASRSATHLISRTQGYHGTHGFGTSIGGIEANVTNWGPLVPARLDGPARLAARRSRPRSCASGRTAWPRSSASR